MCDSFSQNKPIKKKSRQGIIDRLHLRELYGSERHRHGVSPSNQFFCKLPRRLAFKLSDLVSESILQSGHVFLGFTKDGQFVLSYTFQIESGDHSYFYQYRYKLHWWEFVPYRPLKKVYETKLFGDQDISQELKLAVCQWPTDDTKLLVYGCCFTTIQDNLHCYLTITANPPLAPCRACSALRIIPDLDEEDRVNLYEDQPGCFRHQFTLHTRFFLVPPFPSFSPHVCMLKRDVVLVNTGDNLIALTIEVGAPPPPPSPTSCEEELLLAVPSPSPSSTCSEDYSSSDPPGSPRPAPRRFRLPSEDVHSPPSNGPLSPQDPKFLPSKQSVSNTKHKFFSHKWKDEDPKSSKRKDDFFGFESGKSRKGPPKAGGDHCTGEDKRKRNESVKENISPVYRKHVEATAAPVERKCVTEVTQWYMDIFPATDRGQGEEGEEEYHQILPLDVRGTSSLHMRTLTLPEAAQCRDSIIRTHQLSLDIEKLAHETAQQLCAEAGRKFLAFNDYDVGIIDLCPLTHTAFCLVFMLIHATIGKKGVAKAFRSAERKEFQTSFRFNWDINTGIYTVVDKAELREYDPYSVNGPEGLWSPAQHTIKLLHKEHLLTRSPAHSVNVLTNASVFRGSSLRALWAPNHHIAIVL